MAATTVPAAAVSYTSIQPGSWATIDSSSVGDTITVGDALVGAYRDSQGKHHLTKSYFTFDLTTFRGAEIVTAEFVAPQVAAADCGAGLAVELWRTAPAAAPSWAEQPAELARFATPNQLGCPTGQLGWDVAATVAAAVADGRESMTLALRVSEARQGDVAYGRTFSNAPYLRLSHNTAPNPPTELAVGYRMCEAAAVGVAPDQDGLTVRGLASDPDGNDGLTTRVEVWDTANPADVYVAEPGVYGGVFNAVFPLSRIAEGHTYGWRARTVDGDGATSAWSSTCEFTVDQTRPSVPPTVTSDHFVENSGPPGVTGPGTFTFTANGVADVVAFRWHGIGISRGVVSADRPGGSATVSVMPTIDGQESLTVVSLDAAGNASDARIYQFWAATNAPTMSLAGPYYYGERVPVTLTARQQGAEYFVYAFEGDPSGVERGVYVGPDGTATVYITMPRSGQTAYDFQVWTVADGMRSVVAHSTVDINDASPRVSVSPGTMPVGGSATVIIEPDDAMGTDVVSYTWRVDDGGWTSVVPSEDGTVVGTITLTEPGGHTVSAYGNYANGGFSGTRTVSVLVE
ncbi:hypothetical protein [Actinophytocola sp. NPDC049390]|uniref:hypothetical protein n=1 Tax=Actinophytocola sp. NPDC049390 TaxID=3363894 RepID=UPI0037AB2F20